MDILFFMHIENSMISICHFFIELFVNFGKCPVVVICSLNLLEVTDCHSTSIREKIGNNMYTVIMKDHIRFRCGRSIS